MIIVEDASADKCREIIARYADEDDRIKLILNSTNMGVSRSRNRAIEHAKGKYIAFLDSDDIWFSDKLEKQIALMENENILMSYSAYETIDKEGHTIGHFAVPVYANYSEMLKTSIIGTLTMVYNAEVLGKYYLKDCGHEDYAMKLEILKKISYAKGVNEYLAKYRILNTSLSSNKIRSAKWQWYIYRKVENLSLPKSIYCFLHYTFNGIVKYRQ